MSRLKYDFHIHSCLSPCGDEEMTPNNIVNMALLAGCDMIALTDHNSCKNTPAVAAAGRAAGLMVLPGMELCVSEEAHVVCLFQSVEAALAFDEYVSTHMLLVENNSKIFGEQILMDAQDTVIGYENHLLLTASEIGFNEVRPLVESYDGAAFPAHVDRDSYSIIRVLGAIPTESGFRAAELTYGSDADTICRMNPELADMLVLRSSDAHYLETLAGEKHEIEMDVQDEEEMVKRIIEGIRKGSLK